MRFFLSFAFCVLFLGTFIFQTQAQSGEATSQTTAATKAELEARIQARNKELELLNQKIEETQQQLQSTRSERVTLQRQLNSLASNINQLELAIQADELSVQKLGLEIEALTYDVRDIEISIDDKRGTVGYLLREMQRNDLETPLRIFLKNGNLADSVIEGHSLTSVKNKLQIDISNLELLHGTLTAKVVQVNDRRDEIERRQKNAKVKKDIIEDQKEERAQVLSETKNKETVFELQVNELKKQQDTLSDEITEIENQLRAQFDPTLLPSKNPGTFLWPVKLINEGGKGRITQHFGEKSYLYRGKPHNGLDIGAPIGTPVYAAADGIVSAVDNNDKTKTRKYQYGRYVTLKHPNGLSTLYAHLSQQLVSVGASVKQGDVIGYVGNTGYATGPHLHFGVYWTQSLVFKAIPPAAGLVPVGVVVMPEDYLSS